MNRRMPNGTYGGVREGDYNPPTRLVKGKKGTGTFLPNVIGYNYCKHVFEEAFYELC